MPTRLEYSITAKCKPEHVWQKFEKLEEWPWWNRVIGQARWLNGPPWQKGSELQLEVVYPRKMTVRPTIIEANPPHKIAWVGKKMGASGEHWFSFEAQPDGSTLIKTWEDFSGLLNVFATESFKKSIVAMYKTWLEALKFEAERIARDEGARS